MEEEKKVQNNQDSQPQNNQNGQGGRRRRRRKHKSGQNAQGQNAQQQNQGAQAPSAQNTQNPSKNNQSGNGQKSEKKQSAQTKGNQPQQKQLQKQKQKQTAEKNKKQTDNRKDTYVYQLDGKLYINLTNKCSNGCDFCVRNERDSYFGHHLWLNHGDPTVEKVIAACNGYGDLTRFEEVVFCGFGEPTYRMDEMIALCDYFHEKGLKVRLNTNGQGSLINKRDIIPEIRGKIDRVNISLNASCAENYQKICRSQFGENGFGMMIEFAKSCKRIGLDCKFSIVDSIGEAEVEACKKLAQSLKIPLLIRKYISDC